MVQPIRHVVLLCLSFVMMACSPSPMTSTPSPSAFPTPLEGSASPTANSILPPTVLPSPTATPEPEDTGWQTLAPGVEWRRLWADTGAGRERLHLIRFEPDQIRLRVIYQRGRPRHVSQWASILPNALVVTNAGYFTPEHQATGRIISDSIASGRTHAGFAGMLAVEPDGTTTLRWLQAQPYRPDEKLTQAVQSFPMLVKPGGKMGFPPDADEGQRSRRTIVAQDTAGRFVLIASPEFRFSLHELAVWLTESDLDLDIAMNLDGGTSTGLWTRNHQHNVESGVPIPAVIVIEPLDG